MLINFSHTCTPMYIARLATAQPATTTTTEASDEEALLEDEDALEELQTLVDLLLDEEEEESLSENGFQIFLRLSTTPKYLVQGYDFKMLNK